MGGGNSGPAGGAILPGGVGGLLGMGSSSVQGQLGSNPQSTGSMTPAEQMSKPLGSGPTMGAPIIGVASKNTSDSIHEVNERKKYNEWEFFYDPRYDLAAQMSVVPGSVGGAMPGAPNQQVSPFGGQPGGFGNTFGQPSPNPNPSPSPKQ